MNDKFDLEIERILAIKETIANLLQVHSSSSSSSRLDWIEKKIDTLIEELKHED